jgi:DNA-binding beta-propeller fold protein YncE
VLVLGFALGVSVWCSTSALAARGHEFTGTFGEACPGAPCGPGQLKAPSAVAVNESTGDVYVLDEGDRRVERFSATGTYEGQFDGSGKFEVVGAGEPNKEGTAAGFGGQPGEIETGQISFAGEAQTSGIAVDNSSEASDPSKGDLYVIDRGHEVIDKFSAEGEYVGQLSEAAGEALFEAGGVAVERSGALLLYQIGGEGNGTIYIFGDQLANTYAGKVGPIAFRAGNFAPGFSVDGEGDFYLRGRQAGRFEIEKYDHTGHQLSERLDEENSSAVAADQLSNNIFVDNITSVAAFSPSGTELERLTVPGEHGAGLAVNAASETLYVADSEANVIDVYAPQIPGAPSVESEAISGVSGDSASFEAQLNPRGAESSYRFEYGPCTTPSTCSSSPYGQRAPVPDGQLEGDFEIHTVTVHVQGLAPGTSYHFRLGAENEAGGHLNTTHGQERVFITQGAGIELKLPDGRAWELVSPAEKLGSLILPIEETGVVQAAASGDAISYLANAPIEAKPQGTYPGGSQILSTRSAATWSSENLSAPHDGVTGISVGSGKEIRFFTEDLSGAFVQPFGAFTPSISPEATEQTPFLRKDYLNGTPSEPCLPSKTPCYRPLVTGAAGIANVPAGTVFGTPGRCPVQAVCGPELEDATADGSHAVLSSGAALTKAPIEGLGLYSWDATAPPAQQIQLVGVLPNGQAAKQPKLGFQNRNTRGALSADGSRIVWEEASGQNTVALYLRDTTRGETIQLDKAEAGCEEPSECESGAGRFQLASSDGSRVLFTDGHRLTANAGQAGKSDLYECAIVKGSGGKLECRLTDLTPKVGGESADVLGSLPGASEDAQQVYFVANGVLTSEADSEGEQAQAGQCERAPNPGATCNLYALHNGQIRLASVLSVEDSHDWSHSLSSMPARVSPNGQWLAFMSQRLRPGYDNRDAATGQPDAEVYLYGAAKDRVECGSCEPSGARPAGIEYHKLEPSGGLVGGPVGTWNDKGLVAANVPGWTGDALAGTATRHQPRYLSNEGRLYFNSADGLVPQDVNGTEDVYQYEPPGVGGPSGCTTASPNFTARSEGCVDLISSGASSQESAFLDASTSGNDVFFLTSAKLVRADHDAAIDVYDAHQCEGSTCPLAGAEESPPCDTGDSCKAAPSPQPEIFGAPASALFSGAGNLPPPAAASSGPGTGPKKPTRAEQLSKAIKTCRKRFAHAKKRRGTCEQKARRQFGAKKAAAKRKSSKTASSKRKAHSKKGGGGAR